MSATFGIDFGTTNSLISIIKLDDEIKKNVPEPFLQNGGPHPSVVWYAGGGSIVAGQKAKEQLSELGIGVFGDIVRSPKTFLGSPSGIHVGGIRRSAEDVVADILKHLRKDALDRGKEKNPFETAVVTIPVSMKGNARAELRRAAQKAGIRIHRFVHEPLAALYGHLRSSPHFKHDITSLEGRLMLVFDWGGGTLDLTLCQFKSGVLTQVLNKGNPEVGGDRFDDCIRRLVQKKFESLYPKADWMKKQPKAEARLIRECEAAKIALSTKEKRTLVVKDFLAEDGPARNLNMEITQRELEQAVWKLVIDGLGEIDILLTAACLKRTDIEFCLATGGMVSMPAIQNGLREKFGVARYRKAADTFSVISEGAAWIAHDDVPLQMAKPLEILHADDTYVAIIPSGTVLPSDGGIVTNGLDMYCVDPRDGVAKFLFARPQWPGRDAQGDKRILYTCLTLNVDQHAEPLFERLKVTAEIDDNLIATVRASSEMSGARQEYRVLDLEFGINADAVSAKE